MDKQTAWIKYWEVCKVNDGCFLIGEVRHHPRVKDGTMVETSRLLSIDFENNEAETLNTIYQLK